MKAQRYAEAEEQLVPALKAMPDDANAQYCAWHRAFGQARWQEAAELLQRALRKDPADIDTHRALADAWQKLGRDAEAATERDLAAELAADRAEVLVDAGTRVSRKWAHRASVRGIRPGVASRAGQYESAEGLARVEHAE